MNIQEILEYLPHRYPFLLIDRVIECELGKRIRALKNVSVNEPYFNGHFPYYKVMPGVLIVVAMAQAAAILSFRTMGSSQTTSPCTILPGSTGRVSRSRSCPETSWSWR